MAGADGGFSAAEQQAMKERAAELRAEAKRQKSADRAAADLANVLAKIEEMPEHDRRLALRVHELVLETAPDLYPKTWYSMPAYTRDGKVVVFFQSGAKFDSRYCTLGFQDAARLDDGDLWPTSYAVTGIGEAEAERIRELVRRATA